MNVVEQLNGLFAKSRVHFQFPLRRKVVLLIACNRDWIDKLRPGYDDRVALIVINGRHKERKMNITTEIFRLGGLTEKEMLIKEKSAQGM